MKKKVVKQLGVVLAISLILTGCSSWFKGPTVDPDVPNGEQLPEEIIDIDEPAEPVEPPVEPEPIERFSVDYKKFTAGDKIEMKQAFDVFNTAKDASELNNKIATYSSKTYFIYKVVDIAVNLSTSETVPGGWVDLSYINPVNYSHQKKVVVTPPTTPSTPALATKPYAWSWGYPDSSGKSVLEKYNGVYKIHNDQKNLYLTFDNGYEYQQLTADILDILAEKGIKVVFFVTGSYIKNNKALVLRMLAEGHIVGNHTERHEDHARISVDKVKKDLTDWEKSYQTLVGSLPAVKLYRPPAGSFSETSLNVAKGLGYKTVLWAFGYQDWDPAKQPEPAASLTKLLKYNANGNIVLLHAISQTNVDILSDYIDQSIEAGYTFKQLN